MKPGFSNAIVIFLLTASMYSQPNRQQHLTAQIKTPIPSSYFSLHVQHPERSWPPVHFGTWRVIDNHVRWHNVAPRKGQWQFQHLDEIVDIAQQKKVSVLYTLGFPPTWASARPTEAPDYQPGSAAEPRNLDEWRDFVQTIATRYKGRISYWELWNEPNLKHFYTGTPQQLVAAAKVAYETLKKVDPANVVISPSATSSHGDTWLDAYLAAGGGDYADAIGYHFYTTPEGPEDQVPMIQKIRAVMQKYRVSKALWDTEVGWYVQTKAGDVKPEGHTFGVVLSPDEAAGYVARTYILNWLAGVAKCFWYVWDSTTMGISEVDGTPKPAAVAYGTIQEWLIGAVLTSCNSNASGTWVCHITRDGGYYGAILWNPQGTETFKIPTSWKVKRERHLDGVTKDIVGADSIQVGIQPILLETKTP